MAETSFNLEPSLVASWDILLARKPIRSWTWRLIHSMFLEMLSFMRTSFLLLPHSSTSPCFRLPLNLSQWTKGPFLDVIQQRRFHLFHSQLHPLPLADPVENTGGPTTCRIMSAQPPMTRVFVALP